MKRNRYITLTLVLLVLFSQFKVISAYDDLYGIELDDIVDVAFISYRNGEFVIEYTTEGAFRVEVNTNAVNEIFVNAILGMKEGETKPYISWMVGADIIEYYNTTIVDIVIDSTPETTTSTTPSTQTVDYLSCLMILSLIFVSSRFRKN
ncbi:MAG: hypothetical protein GOP50_11920 [Candidatus Heimdallarchaeota archaeon]|nr:hypothetical protein [Candidatus Heimdallarchaeota archaeon]